MSVADSLDERVILSCESVDKWINTTEPKEIPLYFHVLLSGACVEKVTLHISSRRLAVPAPFLPPIAC